MMKYFRKLFSSKFKVTFYMKSGNSFDIEFDEFEISKLSGEGQRTMEWKNSSHNFTVDVNEIEAVIINQ